MSTMVSSATLQGACGKKESPETCTLLRAVTHRTQRWRAKGKCCCVAGLDCKHGDHPAMESGIRGSHSFWKLGYWKEEVRIN